MIRMQVSLEKETNEIIKKIAKEKSLSESSVIRMLLTEKIREYAPAEVLIGKQREAANTPAKEVPACQ